MFTTRCSGASVRLAIVLVTIVGLAAAACGSDSATPTPMPAIVQQTVIQSGDNPAQDPPQPGVVASPTPYASSMPLPTPRSDLVETYVVRSGDTLSGISYALDVPMDELMTLNNLESEAAIIQVGQTLQVPLKVSRTGPQTVLLPDSEVVLSPAYVDFDVDGYIQQQGGYLANFSAPVDGVHISGAEIIKRVTRQNSVGPRVVLALFEHYGGWVTQSQPNSYQPLGPSNPYHDESFLLQVGWAVNRVNEGYYGYKSSGEYPVHFSDDSRAMVPSGINAGSAGIWNILAANSDWETWQAEAEVFLDTYRRLFGEPENLVYEPVVPNYLTQPELHLPWKAGEVFYYTGGPHAAYLSGSAWAAVDFAPPDIVGSCFYSGMDITAAADGRLIIADKGEVYVDLDTDGDLETGWVLLYLHLAPDEGLKDGQLVSAGTPLGYASCEGGFAQQSHLHFARRYNGEWMPADGPVPLVLSGWQFKAGDSEYDGTAVRNGDTKTALNFANDALNAMVGE